MVISIVYSSSHVFNSQHSAPLNNGRQTNQRAELEAVRTALEQTRHDRLENGFYRRLEAFLWDAQLITTNTLVYNEPDSDIVRDAAAVYQMIEALVRRAQRPSRHAAVIASARQDAIPTPLSPPTSRHQAQAVSASSPPHSSRKRARLVESSDSEDGEDIRHTRRRHSQRHSSVRAPRDSSPPASTSNRRVSSRLRG